MTTTRLDAIRQREQAATEGPWFNNLGTIEQGDFSIGEMDSQQDAQFAVHARADIPALLRVAEAAIAAFDADAHRNDKGWCVGCAVYRDQAHDVECPWGIVIAALAPLLEPEG